MNSPPKCAGCRNALDAEMPYLGKNIYNLDCANVTYKLYCLMQRKDKWNCPECLNKIPKRGNTNTPVRNIDTTMDEVRQHVTNKCEGSKRTQKNTENENVTLRVKNPSARSTTTDTTAEFSIMEELKPHMNRVSQLEKSTDLSVLENKIQKLSIKIVEQEQTLLANDIEISGCPEVQNESAMHIIKTIAHKIGIKRYIVNVERVGPRRPEEKDKPYRPRPLIVRLTRRETRDALLTAARVRRGVNTEGLQLPGPTRSLYINEHLSGHNRYLFQKARLLASELKFKYVHATVKFMYGKSKEKNVPGYVRRMIYSGFLENLNI
ncbi:unnamed protein product [Leptidea sinapis]|uniref:Uncharacterized protein n=1 Tax=Leptidea sinapis TaxID=189913 RepID=A0A5E4Q4M8_9NEOP|nr:unnamed protein product [Leptidea sinapis]